MPRAVVETMEALTAVVGGLPIGTNLGLLHNFWAFVTGRLLPNRGALFPALQAIGLDEDEVRRAWAAMAYGAWEIDTLLANWEDHVLEQGDWQPRKHGSYYPVACDLVPFWRPKLKNCQTKHYHPVAGKKIPAIPFGLIVRVGETNGQRVAIPRKIIRAAVDDASEKERSGTLCTVSRSLAGRAGSAGGQADARRRTPIRLRRRESATAPRVGVVVGVNCDLFGGHPAGDPHRLLGSKPEAHAWAPTESAGGGSFSNLYPAAGANSEKGLADRASPEGSFGP